MEPDLLALEDRVDHAVLEAAVDAVHRRRFPGWRVLYDRIKVEMVTGQGRQAGWRDLGGAAQVFTQASAQSPGRVWVIVLEETATERREIVKFLLVDGAGRHPVWMRIRADASVAIPQRARPERGMRIRPRRRP